MKPIDPTAIFRLSVLGPLASRENLAQGELARTLRELAARPYDIPGSKNQFLSEKTIERWFYLWRKGGIEALIPQTRCDQGQSKIRPELQLDILQAKREQPTRSLKEIKRLLECAGKAMKGELSTSSIHRLLKKHDLSRPKGSASQPIERRTYEAAYAGDLWVGDVMHGPRIPVDGRLRKVYLVSLMDDASRLITHSAFCLGETALDIEGVMKQALLRRGLPKKLVLDNGPAYRAHSLQGICARLEIQLIYCRPYTPEAKGKIERWHRTVRDQFLAELETEYVRDLADLNARLWAWLEGVYHVRTHTSLAGLTPRQRWQKDLVRVRPLGPIATSLDDIFLHRVTRKVRKDGTVSWQGHRYEVPYELSGQSVVLVVDPHHQRITSVEHEQGLPLGEATPLDKQANLTRKRCQNKRQEADAGHQTEKRQFNAIEQAYEQRQSKLIKRSDKPEKD
jgi:transposase InsO family protein